MPLSKVPGAGLSGGSVVVSQTAPDNSFVIDSSGNVGIGTSSPQVQLQVNASGTNSLLKLSGSSSGSGLNDGLDVGINTLDAIVWNREAGSLQFATSNSERMRIDSSGNLLVNTTTATNPSLSQGFVTVNATGTKNAMVARLNQSGYTALAVEPIGHNSWYFGYMANSSGGNIGSISCNSTSTAYNTSSDYRLKENIAPMTGALAKVSALKPCTYTWKSTGEESQGFIAHELAEVVPECVTGEKDAVDAEGNPVYQGIDTSFLVATLTAAIQEQQQIINDLKARIETLEAK